MVICVDFIDLSVLDLQYILVRFDDQLRSL